MAHPVTSPPRRPASSAKKARSFGGRIFQFLGRLTRTQLQILIVLAALLLGLRVALPHLVKWYVNKTLDEMPDYDGRIGDVDMKLWRGAYQIQSVDIVKTSGDVPVPFFSSQQVEFSVEWRALFEGALVGQIKFQSPVINFVAGPTEETSQVGVDKPWIDVIDKLFPLDINRFEVTNGTVHYRDFHSSPKIDLEIDRIHALATNLTNSRKLSKTLVANITAKGRAFQESDLILESRVDPSTKRPTFDLNFKMDPVALTKLNDFTRAYAAFDFEKGTMALAAELASNDGTIKGYIKPLFDGVAVVNLKEDIKNPLQLVWEGAVGGVMRLFRNQPKARFATKIPISGSFSNPKVAILPTLGNVLRNEFIRAYQGDIENIIDLGDATGAPPDQKNETKKEDRQEEKKPATTASSATPPPAPAKR